MSGWDFVLVRRFAWQTGFLRHPNYVTLRIEYVIGIICSIPLELPVATAPASDARSWRGPA